MEVNNKISIGQEPRDPVAMVMKAECARIHKVVAVTDFISQVQN